MAQQGEVTYDPQVMTPERIQTLIEDMGFDAEILENQAGRGEESLNLIVSYVFINHTPFLFHLTVT